MNQQTIKKLISVLVVAQLIIILALIVKINKGNTLGVYVSPVKTVAVYKPENSIYEYFYELLPDTEDTVKQEMVGQDKKIIIKTNKDSLSDLHDYSVEKEPRTFRIATLGDSFTFGYNVSTADNWSEILEGSLLKYNWCAPYEKSEVINLGVYGYNIQYEVERYRIRGQKYDPDLLVWLVEDDDFIEDENKIRKIIISEGKNPDEIDSNTYYEAWEKIISERGIEGVISDQAAGLKKIREYYKKSILLLYIGHDQRVENSLKAFVKGTPGIDYMKLNLDSTLTFSDAHPNEKGHRYIAEKVFNYLIDKKTKICESK